MRYTEYHAGVAVIKKNQTKGAAAKLAKIEDMDYIPQSCLPCWWMKKIRI